MARTKRKQASGDSKSESANTDREGIDSFSRPSPNAKTNLVVADIVLRSGGVIVRNGLERGLLGANYAPKKAAQILKGRTLGQTLVGAAIAKIATKSVPGAILVGGGLLAKTLFDRRKGRLAQLEGEKPQEAMAEKGDGRRNNSQET